MLIDFGSSKIFDASLRAKPSASHLGTLDYAAPEVFTSGCYTDKSDMWSLGVTAFMLLTGYCPFSDEDGEESMRRSIKKGEFTVQDSWNEISTPAADFVRKLLTVNPVCRLSAQEALRHPFMVEHRSLAAAAVGALVDAHTVESLYAFSCASKFQRACMSVMAWSMASEDRALLRQSFLAIDKTKRGTTNLVDFKACIEEYLELTDDEIKDVFVTLDASQTGVIHYTEFCAAMMASEVPLHDSLLVATFHRFDVRNTGFIEVDDLRNLLVESFEGEDFALQLKEADSNGDGKISYKEFVEFATESVMQLNSKDSSIGSS